jgi:SAM-dependent methyltransferase
MTVTVTGEAAMPDAGSANDPGAATCPICGGHRLQPLGSHGEYRLARCRICQHSFVINLPTADTLRMVYERYSYDVRHLQAVPAFVFPILTGVVTTFASHRRTNRLLDVGFGAGALLRVATDRGWEAHGIETSALAVRQARANGVAHVIEGDFFAAPYREGLFDVIVMDGVLEHLPEPAKFVQKAARLLRPAGLFYATTPHGRGLSGRLLGTSWSVSAPPEHLHLFSRGSMVRCLRNAGFSGVRVQTRGTNPYELVAYLRRRLRPSAAGISFDRVTSSYRLNEALVSSRNGRIVKQVVNGVLDWTRLGDGLAVYATTRGAPAC